MPLDGAQVSAVPATVRSKHSFPQRNLLFLLLVALSVAIFWASLKTVLGYQFWGDSENDEYFCTLVVPVFSLALVLIERHWIFSRVRYGIRPGTVLLLLGVLLRIVAGAASRQIGSELSISIDLLGLVTFGIGAFILCYGTLAFQAGRFPLLFLLAAVPLPSPVFETLLAVVRAGSAEVSGFLFSLSGVPVLRNGMDFSLPDVTIRVERACSGIHSTLAIVLVSLIAAHLFLASAWRKLLLVLAAVPIVCITNGCRIAGLTLLAQYVNRQFLYGNLHHHGGIGFFALALLLLYLVLQLLRIGTPQTSPRVERSL